MLEREREDGGKQFLHERSLLADDGQPWSDSRVKYHLHMATTTFTIGEAAARSGVTVDTIRFYERIGVLPKPPRSDGNYRRYSEASVARIAFVRNAARFGFPLKELAAFLRARERGQPPCRAVKAAGDRLLSEMDRRIAELSSARNDLATTLAEWERRLASTRPGAPARLLESLGDVS
jgi:DNA-binding transcriptional MerR regulator